LVGSWIFMISFFVFAAFSVFATSDIFPALMILSIFLWIGSGIAYIRFRRLKKKSLSVRLKTSGVTGIICDPKDAV
jgi:hypothetical protein